MGNLQMRKIDAEKYFDLTTVLLQKTIDDFTCHLAGCQTDFRCCLGEVLYLVGHRLEDACLMEGGHLVAFLGGVHQVVGRQGAFLEVAFLLAFLDVAAALDLPRKA